MTMTITCSNCGRENATDNTFCGGCGKQLEMLTSIPETSVTLCVRCNTKMPEGALFCGICGKSLSGPPKPESPSAPPSHRIPSTLEQERPEQVRPDQERPESEGRDQERPGDWRSGDERPDEVQPADKAAVEADARHEEAAAGNVSAGNVSAANVSAGNVSAGNVSAGNVSAGKLADGQPFRTGKLLREMVEIPGGTFLMGSLPGYGNDDECPQHRVTLGDFRIDRFAVSNIEFEQFRPRHQRTPTSSGDLDPVVYVSFEDCVEYCNWRSEQEGLPSGCYRLVTEAQWEYCARGGQDFLFPWGDEFIDGVANTREGGLGRAIPVDEGVPNGFNLLHMGSNVREWCSDWYNEAFYSMDSATRTNPTGPAAMEFVNMKVIRGASFQDLASDLSRCAARNCAHPRTESDDIGFRCVRDA